MKYLKIIQILQIYSYSFHIRDMSLLLIMNAVYIVYIIFCPILAWQQTIACHYYYLRFTTTDEDVAAIVTFFTVAILSLFYCVEKVLSDTQRLFGH